MIDFIINMLVVWTMSQAIALFYMAKFYKFGAVGVVALVLFVVKGVN